MHAEVTRESLLEAIRKAMDIGPETDGAFTTRELCQELGLGEKAARRWIESLKREGRIQVVTVQRKRLDDEYRPTTAYRLVA